MVYRSRSRGRQRMKKKGRTVSQESMDRSREREMRRRKQQQQFVQKNRGPTGASTTAASSTGASSTGALPGASSSNVPNPGQQMFWDGFQWVPRAVGADQKDPNATRKLRRLFIGNLPYHLGCTEDLLAAQLYQGMRDRNLCNNPDTNPIQHVWFVREKGANYGFVEVATIEEADRMLQLDGMIVLGVPVQMKRPTDSMGPLLMLNDLTRTQQLGMAPGAVSIGSMNMPQVLPTATSRIIRIEQILRYDSNTTTEDFDDVIEDMKEGCAPHGNLQSAFVVRPYHKEQIPFDDVNIGDVFLDCGNKDIATKIMRTMGQRKYDGRPVSMKSFDETRYDEKIKLYTTPA